MTTKEGARFSAGAESHCTTNYDSLTDEQRGLIEKLHSISALIEQYRASIAMLEIERLKLQTALRLTGWRPPRPCGSAT